jgi:hypothetical protein
LLLLLRAATPFWLLPTACALAVLHVLMPQQQARVAMMAERRLSVSVSIAASLRVHHSMFCGHFAPSLLQLFEALRDAKLALHKELQPDQPEKAAIAATCSCSHSTHSSAANTCDGTAHNPKFASCA